MATSSAAARAELVGYVIECARASLGEAHAELPSTTGTDEDAALLAARIRWCVELAQTLLLEAADAATALEEHHRKETDECRTGSGRGVRQ